MERALIAAAALVLASCSALPPQVVLPPAPPPYVSQDCEDWPELEGDGRVDMEAAAEAARQAKIAWADCKARHEAARRYIKAIRAEQRQEE